MTREQELKKNLKKKSNYKRIRHLLMEAELKGIQEEQARILKLIDEFLNS